jgi:aryl-alcohol dehydrogenase-like predicted oxidoreductase
MGLGTNRISEGPEAVEVLRQAVSMEINFIDTAHTYARGASETTIGKTLAPYPDGLVVATKGGYYDARREVLRAELEESLQRLRTDQIDLYQLHRVAVAPLEESVTALKEFQDEGLIRHIGLSEVSVEQIQRARAIAAIVSVQNEYNVLTRQYEDVLDYCTAEGIVFIPWFPLGGLSGGAETLATMLAETAGRYGVSGSQLALAWLLKRSPQILPIPGTLSVEHLRANLRAAEVTLTDEDFEAISALGR